MFDLNGKVAFITGSGRGMGQSHAVVFAQRGAKVVVHDLVAERASETCGLVKSAGGECISICADVSDVRAMQEAVRSAEDAFGKIDILVNNAGISAERSGIEGITEELFDRMIGIHLKGTVFTTQAVIPGMKARRSGKIIDIASIWGMTGHHFGATYCAAKAALLGLTKAWAKEFAPWNICVNAVSPGAVATKMQIEVDGEEEVKRLADLIPLRRIARLEEMSAAVLYLAASGSDFVTGQNISPNGGDTIV